MSTYTAGFILGLIAAALATGTAWALTNLRSWAERRDRHRLDPLPGPPRLSDQIISATARYRSLDRRYPEHPARDEVEGPEENWTGGGNWLDQ